jgi:hypothetical protein
MEHDGTPRRTLWRRARVLGAAALTTGVLGGLAVALPAGPALASAQSARPAAAAAPQYSLDFVTTAKALGHTWAIDFSVGGNTVDVLVGTRYGSTDEDYDWTTSEAFSSTAAKDLKVTSTGHATFSTGKALSPVLAANVTFTPAKVAKEACAKGSGTLYTGTVSGAVTLQTGLNKVTFKLTFTGKPGATLDADKSCMPPTPPTKTPCAGGSWFLGGPGSGISEGGVSGEQTLGSKPAWHNGVSVGGIKTANKFVTRSLLMAAAGPAPTVSTAKKTVSVAGTGAITGAAVIAYGNSFAEPPMICYLNGKKYAEATTGYFGQSVKVTKAFQAHAVLAGPVPVQVGSQAAFYSSVKLSAA